QGARAVQDRLYTLYRRRPAHPHRLAGRRQVRRRRADRQGPDRPPWRCLESRQPRRRRIRAAARSRPDRGQPLELRRAQPRLQAPLGPAAGGGRSLQARAPRRQAIVRQGPALRAPFAACAVCFPATSRGASMVEKARKFGWLVRLGYAARGLTYLLLGYMALGT